MLLDKVPKKLVAAAGVAALGYYADRQLLLSHDLRTSGRAALALVQVKRLLRANALVGDVFEASARKWPRRVCMRFEDRALTFAECDARANRVARWALQRGLRAGQTVALLMENRPEFVLVWIGLSKVGVITALINTHLQADGLVHCVKLAGTKELVVGSELLDRVATVEQQLHGTSVHVLNDLVIPPPDLASYPFAHSFDAQLEPLSDAQLPLATRRSIGTLDTALLIFTSGTTGMPKAARLSHFTVIGRSFLFASILDVGLRDRIYCALPLYHTAGGNVAVVTMIISGATLCISRRFSTTKFWDEVRSFDCTMVQYIGEMCRYLVNAPASESDKVNSVRLAFGNGLRPDVWGPFQERFGIPAVFEFYGSTEGTTGIMNYCRRPEDRGHLGRHGALMAMVTGNKLVKYDVDRDEHIRDPKTGFLQMCGANEPGELVSPINDSDPLKRFNGYYQDERESSKKVLRDVFKKGDMYFRTGDLFRIDERSCWHFVDRIGDTFRWKGENVATNEVSEAIATFPGLSDICIYGVQVPGNEGRACMAAIVFDDANFDLSAFAQHVQRRLPSYAMPLFIRQLPAMSVTGTMKHEKAKLRKQGVDPSLVEDKLWFFSRAVGAYERLTSENYHRVLATSRL